MDRHDADGPGIAVEVGRTLPGTESPEETEPAEEIIGGTTLIHRKGYGHGPEFPHIGELFPPVELGAEERLHMELSYDCSKKFRQRGRAGQGMQPGERPV